MSNPVTPVLNLRHPDFKSVRVTAPVGGYTAGELVAVGAFVGQIAEAALEGVAAVLIYACQKIVLPKAAGAVSVGDRLYFDPDNSCLTTTPVTPGYCAICTEAAGAVDTTVECDLFGIPQMDLTNVGS